jgi:hypothetical protein
MTRRSLILAGGGLKIAYQAGVLQVWLDEARIEFDHADAVSAATFNLAMWCQGMTGRRIADNWRTFPPLRAIAPNPRLHEALLSHRRIRRNVFPAWGLDLDAVRASPSRASFNVHNVAELWIVWTTSTAGRWRKGPVGTFFGIFELATNSRLRAAPDRIDQSNAALARGEHGAYGRHVTVHLLEQEVPLHYLFNFRTSRFRQAVEMGVADARAWCRARGML